MSHFRILCLGAGDGWHAQQLDEASKQLDCQIEFSTYESLRSSIVNDTPTFECEVGRLDNFDVLLTRTMPAGSLEQVTFRLAILHAVVQTGIIKVVNEPSALEIAIDKFATLQRIAAMGFPVPDTAVAQSRRDAMDAFHRLGGDCVVKPVFGGEGRGVMRICDAELAWTAFSTLENLNAICYVQRFVPPGGADTRLLVIGDTVRAIRRTNPREFRTNVSHGGRCEAIALDDQQEQMATRICREIGLRFASVDLLHFDQGPPKVIEVNGIPGWKGAQSVTTDKIAAGIITELKRQFASPGTPGPMSPKGSIKP